MDFLRGKQYNSAYVIMPIFHLPYRPLICPPKINAGPSYAGPKWRYFQNIHGQTLIERHVTPALINAARQN